MLPPGAWEVTGMILIDMHVHSTYSDGTFTVGAIVHAAKKRHLSLLSLTDHDTTDGLLPFRLACEEYGVQGLSGIELSADSDHTLHILGFRIVPDNTELERKLDDIRNYRDVRNAEICKKLQADGLDILLEDAKALSGGQVVARPHIARLMIQKGYVSTMAEAFIKYLGPGGRAYVSRARLSAEECISLINGAGGLAVLAHPAQTRLDDDGLGKLISRLRDCGLWGIEALYPGHSPEQIYSFLSLADKFGLYPTAGSDFHGGCGQDADLGIPVSEDFIPWARLGVKI